MPRRQRVSCSAAAAAAACACSADGGAQRLTSKLLLSGAPSLSGLPLAPRLPPPQPEPHCRLRMEKENLWPADSAPPCSTGLQLDASSLPHRGSRCAVLHDHRGA